MMDKGHWPSPRPPEPPSSGSIFILCGSRVTDQGIVSGIAHDLLRDRFRLGAQQIQILADVDVKHSAPWTPRPLSEEVHEMRDRGGADVLLVTGRATGGEVSFAELLEIQAAAAPAPVWVASGVSADTIGRLAPHADGFIVGSALKVGGRLGNQVDPHRVHQLMEQRG